MDLIATPDLVGRAAQIASAYTQSRMRVLERLEGNPLGIEIRIIDGAAVALIARDLPSPFFNSVLGLRADHEALIPSLAAWYRASEANGRFVVEPAAFTPALGRALAKAGHAPVGFHAILIGAPGASAPNSPCVAIERVATADAMEAYLDAYVAGWSIPDAQRDGFKANVRPWLAEPGWALYLARVDGRPAAAATLYHRDGGAYCADAATVPAYRRRGLQTALLARRIADAGAAGAAFVCSGADYLSGSHRNMERAGLRLLSLRTVWAAE
ncbi:MAG: GNAT family N-acetyltransferase [Roseiarcus sp.]|jgi:ribosomal protein S18 acetylase RimI-like enzyme